MDVRTYQRTEESIRGLLLRYRSELAFTVGVDIVFHCNRSTMVSWSRKGAHGALRVHQIFGGASEDVLEAIVRHFFTKVPARELRQLRSRIMDYVEQNRLKTLNGNLPRVNPPKGKVYDLDRVRRKVTRRYVPERLSERLAPRMSWSCRVTPSLMGKWIERPPGTRNLIIINRLLDNKKVPAFYIEYIVYHEILHELFPIRRQAGRWVHHSVEFRRREKTFPLYREARLWEEEQLPRLLVE